MVMCGLICIGVRRIRLLLELVLGRVERLVGGLGRGRLYDLKEVR